MNVERVANIINPSEEETVLVKKTFKVKWQTKVLMFFRYGQFQSSKEDDEDGNNLSHSLLVCVTNPVLVAPMMDKW